MQSEICRLLVIRRGELMQEAAEEQETFMAAVLKLAEEGMDVAFLYRSADAEAEALCRQCAAFQAKVKAYACDVSDEDQVKQTLKAVQKDFGPARLLVNNAGITDDGLVMTMKEENISKLERGNANLSIRTLQRLAVGMGMKLRLEFLPDATGVAIKR